MRLLISGSMMSSAAAIAFPAALAPPHKCPCSGPSKLVGAGDGSSSSRLVSRTSQTGSQTQMASHLHGSSFFTGGSISFREDNVSTGGRAANVWIRSSSSSRASSSASGNPKSRSNAGPEVLPALNPNNSKSELNSLEQSSEAPAPQSEGGGNGDVNGDFDPKPLPPLAIEAQLGNENERVPAGADKKAAEAVVGGEDPSLPTMEDIVAAAAEEGVKLQVKPFGPTFQILVTNLDESVLFGKADGWIKWWWPKGKIVHLETVKLERGLTKQVGNIFGAGFYVGASTLRYGLDQGCQTAELLAIYDDEVAHRKLVKYYKRLGFKSLYEVNEEELKYFPDRVVWGGVGTRMDADCEGLLRKWSVVLKPKGKLRSTTKGFSSRS